MKIIKLFILLLSLSLTVCACEEEKEIVSKPGGTEIDGGGAMEDKEKEPDTPGTDDDGTKDDEEKEPDTPGTDDDGTKDDEENEFKLKPGDTFKINCDVIGYISNIGKDSASAVDSIKRFYEQTRPDLLPESIQPQRLNVDFPYDNRLFWILLVIPKEVSVPVFFWLDAVDSKGNHYWYGACDD